MNTPTLILSVIHLIFCIALILVIVLQPGKSAGLSGSIAGGAETFFGKNKGRTLEAKLEKMTRFIAIGFIVLTLVLFLLNK